jgi:PKD repeat protein
VSEGQSPLNVRFESTSAGEIASYDWEFGNGLTGITETTGHMYTAAGIYTVTHTVTGPGGSDTFVLDDAITVLPGPAASIEITSNAPNGTAGDSLEFSAMVADEYGNTVDESVIWTVDEAAGSITTAGVFTASTSATRSSTASQTTRGASGTLSTRSSSLATIRRTTLRITGQKANGIRQTL